MGRRPGAQYAAKDGEFSDRWIVGRAELSEVLGISVSAVSKLVDKGMPRVSTGKYSVPHCVQYYVDLWRTGSATGDEGESLDLRSRLTLAQAKKYELDAEIMRGHYVSVEVVERVVSEATASLAASLDGLGARLAGVLADETEPAAVQGLVTGAAREVRDQYARALAAWAEDVAAADTEDMEDGGSDTQTATGTNGG